MKRLWIFSLLISTLLSTNLQSSMIPASISNQVTNVLVSQISPQFSKITSLYQKPCTGMFKTTMLCPMSWQYKNTSAYDILNVQKDVTDLKILKNAYIAKAKKTHPDSKNGSEEDFKKVNAAYEYLEWTIKNNCPVNDSHQEKQTEDENQEPINNQDFQKKYYTLGAICTTCSGYKLYKDILNNREKSLFSGLRLISKLNKHHNSNKNNKKGDGILLFAVMSFIAFRETYYGAIEIYNDFINPLPSKH